MFLFVSFLSSLVGSIVVDADGIGTNTKSFFHFLDELHSQLGIWDLCPGPGRLQIHPKRGEAPGLCMAGVWDGYRISNLKRLYKVLRAAPCIEIMSLESSIIDDCDVPQVATATTVLVLILIQVLKCQVALVNLNWQHAVWHILTKLGFQNM